jgi:hypothetical protein
MNKNQEHRWMVYWNLNNQCFSFASSRTYRVYFHSDSFAGSDITYRVRQAGRNRVRNTRAKNVHAFIVVRGLLLPKHAELRWAKNHNHNNWPVMVDKIVVPDDTKQITYNPYSEINGFHFVDSDEILVSSPTIFGETRDQKAWVGLTYTD